MIAEDEVVPAPIPAFEAEHRRRRAHPADPRRQSILPDTLPGGSRHKFDTLPDGVQASCHPVVLERRGLPAREHGDGDGSAQVDLPGFPVELERPATLRWSGDTLDVDDVQLWINMTVTP